MNDLPIRVAVISRNHLVRAGLVSLIAQLEARAIVTEATSADDPDLREPAGGGDRPCLNSM